MTLIQFKNIALPQSLDEIDQLAIKFAMTLSKAILEPTKLTQLTIDEEHIKVTIESTSKLAPSHTEQTQNGASQLVIAYRQQWIDFEIAKVTDEITTN